MKLPKQYKKLYRYIYKRNCLRLLGFALWCTALIGGVVAYNNNHKTYPDYRRIIGWKFAVCVLAAVVSGILIFKLWKLMTDRTRVGTVIASGISHTYTGSSDPDGTSNDYDFRTHTTLRIRLDDGRTRRLRFEQKNGFYLYYHEGERIVKFHGLPYPLNLDRTEAHGRICSACGTHAKKGTVLCDACSLPLIDPNTVEP